MFEVTKKLVPLAFAVYVLFVPSGLTASANVDLSTNKQLTQEFYESMLTKRALLGDDGADEALQEYYANQQISDQNKRELSVVAELINLFTDDVLGDYYQQWIDGYLDIPSGGVSSDVLDDTYSRYTGFYKTSADSQPYSCSYNPAKNGIIVSSQHFSLSVNWEFIGFEQATRTYEMKSYNEWNSQGRYHIGSSYEYSSRGQGNSTCYVYRILQGSGGFASLSGRDLVRTIPSSYGSGVGRCCVQLDVGTSLPVIDITNMSVYINPTQSKPLAAWGSIVNLPQGNLTQEPWEYFNTKFLPWVRGECDNLGFDYTKICPYPEGYTPPHDPLEPAPLVPIATRPYSPFYHKATETYTEAVTQTVTQVVTDESGEPVTDNNGDTSVITDTQLVTDQNGDVIYETYIQAVTNSDGDDEYVYEFNIPDLPELKIPDGTLPLNEIDLSSHSAQMGGIWEAINRILTDSGLISIVVPFLAIGLLIYILTKLG